MGASYGTLVDLFASFENFLSRLSIYTGITHTPALTNILVKIIVELISTLALATKQVKQGRFSEFVLFVVRRSTKTKFREIYGEAEGREGHRSGYPKVG